MIVEAVGIAVGIHSQGGKEHREARRKAIREAMEQAVLDVLAEGINDPEERARVTAERMQAAREKAKREYQCA